MEGQLVFRVSYRRREKERKRGGGHATSPQAICYIIYSFIVNCTNKYNVVRTKNERELEKEWFSTSLFKSCVCIIQFIKNGTG